MLIKLEQIRGAEMLVEEGNLRERIKKAQKGDKSSEEGRNKDVKR